MPLIIIEVSDDINEINLIFGIYNLGSLNTILARIDIISCINKNKYRPYPIIPNYIRDT
jgi:hypothetical protein